MDVFYAGPIPVKNCSYIFVVAMAVVSVFRADSATITLLLLNYVGVREFSNGNHITLARENLSTYMDMYNI